MCSIPPAFILMIGAALLPLLPRQVRSISFLIFPVWAFMVLLNMKVGNVVTVSFLNYELILCQVDKLSLVFGYVFAIAAFIGGIYAFHIDDIMQQSSTLLYVSGAFGVTFAGDLFTVLAFWELMAVASATLVWAKRTPESNKSAMRYLMYHMIGGSLLMAGILLHYHATGSILFNHFEPSIASYLIMISFCINAAVPPFHAWLPDAYPQGTITSSVFLSAFTTKTAVYVLIRGFAGHEILIWGGVIMALYGVVFAVLENDVRRLLAYHIISQVGYMVTAVGIGTTMALNGAAAHAFAHILYKGLLFMGVGAVLYSTGKSKLTELGGLATAMPVILGLYMIGAFSISGFPLFSGFVSKSMVISAAAEDHLNWVAMLLTLASIGTFLHTGLKLPYFTWMGENQGAKPEKPIPIGMYIGMSLAAALCFAIGVLPSMFYELLPHSVHYHPYSPVHLVETSQLLIFTGISFWYLINKLGGEATLTLDTDWFYRKTGPFCSQITATSLNGLNELAEKWIVKGVISKLCYFTKQGPANLAAFILTPYWRLRFNPEQVEKERHNLYRTMDTGATTLAIMSLGFTIYIALMLYWVA